MVDVAELRKMAKGESDCHLVHRRDLTELLDAYEERPALIQIIWELARHAPITTLAGLLTRLEDGRRAEIINGATRS